MFKKLKFWGRKKDLDLNKDLGIDLPPLPGEEGRSGSAADSFAGDHMPGLGQDMPSTQPSFGQDMNQQSFPQPSMAQSPPPMAPPVEASEHESKVIVKNLEVISYKLDAIQAILNSLNQRINNLETKEENKNRFKY